MPLRAAPTTTTRRPRTEKSVSPTPSPQLQCRQAEPRQDDGQNAKSGEHLWRAPPNELEVMMDGRHLEDTLTGELEGRDLNDDRRSLEYEHAPHDDEEELLLDENRDGA